MNTQLKDLSLEKLQELLKEVKLYRNMRKQLGNRGKLLYHNIKAGTTYLEVEYFPVVGEDLAWEQAKLVYKTVFKVEVERKDIVFIENEKLKGWIKVYRDDMMVDMSYNQVEKQISK